MMLTFTLNILLYHSVSIAMISYTNNMMVAGMAGLEPATDRVTTGNSTIELHSSAKDWVRSDAHFFKVPLYQLSYFSVFACA